MKRIAPESSNAALMMSLATTCGVLLFWAVFQQRDWCGLLAAATGESARQRMFDEQTAGYYEDLLNAGEQMGGHLPWQTLGTPERAEQPENWPKLHETDGVTWDDPFQRFRLRPGSTLEYKGASLDVNALGIRDRPVAIPAPEGVRRVVLVGASILMGSGVPVELVFENVVEDSIAANALGERAQPVEFVNLGVAGYRIDQLADVVEQWAGRFEPDAVVVVLNDLMVNPNWSRHLVKLVVEQRDLRYPYLQEVVRDAGISPETPQAGIVTALEPYRDRVIHGALAGIKAWCSERDLPLVFLVVPQPGADAVLRQRLESVDPPLSALGVPTLSLLGAFDDHGDAKRFWLKPWDRHPTIEGHALLAEAWIKSMQARPKITDLLLGPTTGTGDDDE
ncbi:MAG: SGNH/GDSL hydrolase family protein [Phycisphaerales bacterium]|nr:SGNH/GDSL hydrolase family protein [Phycisphaerales bacterium]